MKVELIDYMGSDDRVVDAARVSFNKGASSYSSQQNSRLIKYLAEHGHFTPFTHPQITLRETVPIFVARQRLKHFVGFTYNEVSRRYVDDDPEFYEPELWRSRPDGSVKQGSGEVFNKGDQEVAFAHYSKALERCQDAYYLFLDMGMAPEQARMVLPQSMYTSYYVTGSLAAFARFYKQRIDVHAQKEIQELAERVGEIIAPMFPVSWKALTEV